MRHDKTISMTVAGYNLDASIIEKIQQLVDIPRQTADEFPYLRDAIDNLAEEPLTPETLSAAYARISRSPMGIKDLRRDSRSSVNRARQSNERIVFGLGHASIAEHAIFNLDIVNASRLALEEIEKHRLASYTESSQRYIALTGDYSIPSEVTEIGEDEIFIKTCESLFGKYRELIEALESLHGDLSERDRNTKSREDARYILPLCCRGQVGVTLNARTAETMIRSFNNSALAEVRVLGRQMAESLRRVVPSLIKYIDSRPIFSEIRRELKELSAVETDTQEADKEMSVQLVSYPENDERMALAAILFKAGKNSLNSALSTVDEMNSEARRNLLLAAHRYINEHDPMIRELELGYFVFEVVLSASAFAQFKRHRIATLISQSYDPRIGVTIPPNIERAGAVNIFQAGVKEAEELYYTLRDKLNESNKGVADYALTNAHRRRVIFQANARELTHLSRLREDIHAQWDIRRLSREMIHQAGEACPALMSFTAGKDKFGDLRNGLYGSDSEDD